MPRNIVLDLDECLVKMFTEEWDTYERIMNSSELFHLRGRVIVIKLDEGDYMWGIKRPYLDEFLMFCFARFDTVSVWSAGTLDYVHLITEKIFGDIHLPDAVLTRLNVESAEEIGYCKPLDRFYKIMRDGSVGPSNTFLLDNRRENFVKNTANGIRIPDYDPLPTIEDLGKKDNALLRFMKFCSATSPNTDIRRINTGRIFAETQLSQRGTVRAEYYGNFRNPVFFSA